MNNNIKQIIFFIVTLILINGKAYSGQENTKLKYDVYAGGMHALEATLDIDKNKSDYTVGLQAKTHGFIGNIFPWQADYKTDGIIRNNIFIPHHYKSSSSWKDKVKKTELKYSKNGDFLEKIVEKNNKISNQSNMDSNLTNDSVDMLTAAVTLLNQTAEQQDRCDGSVNAFDGKRKFKIIFKNAGVTHIKKSKYSVYQGKAIKCTVKVEPVAGFRKKDKKKGWMAVQNHTMERKKLPTIWIASLNDSKDMVPVRMEIASSYGTVIAHLTRSNVKPELLSAK